MDINSQKNIGIHVSHLMRISLGSFLSDSVDERNVAKSRIKRIAASTDVGTRRFRCNNLRSLNKVESSGMDYRPCTWCLVFASPIVAKFLANSKLPLPDFCDIRFRSNTRSSRFHLSFCPFYSRFLISPLFFLFVHSLKPRVGASARRDAFHS